MNPSEHEPRGHEPRGMREAVIGYGLFSTKDALTWTSYLEDLGALYAEAWRDVLPAVDREWAAAQREKFGTWVAKSPPDGLEALAPPWPMLIEAVKSAFFACIEGFKSVGADKGDRACLDTASRLERAYLWQLLSSDDTTQVHRPEALRAFQRGFRVERRGRPSSMRRPIAPMLEPPWYWGRGPRELPGPSAAHERALRALPFPENDRQAWEARRQELRELYASAWREDVPEEDREWAETYRRVCSDWVNTRRRDAIARSAYEGYLQSSDGIFNGEPAKPWSGLSHRMTDPWRAFVDRIEDAPQGESERATAEAATREYWDALYREAPPWESDPAQAHWLAAARAARIDASAAEGFAP